jgi:hypothetical protein
MAGETPTGESEQAGAPASGEEKTSREAQARRPSPRPMSRSAAPAEATSPADRWSAYKSEDTAPEPAPRERPGLGTEWGETRESRVHDVAFFRATPGLPFGVAQLYYNDRPGVEALTAYHGGGTPYSLDVSAANGAITVYIVDREWGMPLEATRVGDRTYVVGQEGHRYSIILANRTGHRYEAVATVDGLDVINGKPGSYDNRGYLLSPWDTLEIDGFRQSQDAVAAFRFSKVSESYAERRGQGRNVGVIGVAFFAERGERGDEYPVGELRKRDTARPFPGQGRFAPPPPW